MTLSGMRHAMLWALTGVSLLPSALPAQSTVREFRWWAQVSPIAIQYHTDFNYSPSLGLQLAAGRQWHTAFSVLLKLNYSCPRQSFLWLGETRTFKSDWYGSQIALRVHLPVLQKFRLHFYSDLQAGLVHLHPRTLTLNGGVQGSIVFALPSENYFTPGLAGGLNYRCTKSIDAYLFLENSWMKITARQLNTHPAHNAWKPYQQLGAGLLLRF